MMTTSKSTELKPTPKFILAFNEVFGFASLPYRDLDARIRFQQNVFQGACRMDIPDAKTQMLFSRIAEHFPNTAKDNSLSARFRIAATLGFGYSHPEDCAYPDNPEFTQAVLDAVERTIYLLTLPNKACEVAGYRPSDFERSYLYFKVLLTERLTISELMSAALTAIRTYRKHELHTVFPELAKCKSTSDLRGLLWVCFANEPSIMDKVELLCGKRPNGIDIPTKWTFDQEKYLHSCKDVLPPLTPEGYDNLVRALQSRGQVTNHRSICDKIASMLKKELNPTRTSNLRQLLDFCREQCRKHKAKGSFRLTQLPRHPHRITPATAPVVKGTFEGLFEDVVAPISQEAPMNKPPVYAAPPTMIAFGNLKENSAAEQPQMIRPLTPLEEAFVAFEKEVCLNLLDSSDVSFSKGDLTYDKVKGLEYKGYSAVDAAAKNIDTLGEIYALLPDFKESMKQYALEKKIERQQAERQLKENTYIELILGLAKS